MLAHYKNNITGVIWHITDDVHIKRLRDDSKFIEVTNTSIQETNQTHAHSQIQDSVTEIVEENTENSTGVFDEKEKYRIEVEMMEWQELRQFASEKGINTKGMKRKQIEKELLNKLSDENVTN